jgi:hypothetical protein
MPKDMAGHIIISTSHNNKGRQLLPSTAQIDLTYPESAHTHFESQIARLKSADRSIHTRKNTKQHFLDSNSDEHDADKHDRPTIMTNNDSDNDNDDDGLANSDDACMHVHACMLACLCAGMAHGQAGGRAGEQAGGRAADISSNVMYYHRGFSDTPYVF